MMLTRNLESNLERLARIIGRQYRVNVVFRGSGAMTDGSTIYLPSTKDLSDELIADLHGFLDHEVSHIKFTDFGQITKCEKGKGGRFHRELLNMVEDVRIERLMIAEYPGCRRNLEPLNYKLIAKLKDKWTDLPIPTRIICNIGFEMSGREAVADDTAPILAHVKSLTDKLNDCETTEALRLLTKKITKKILKKLDEDKKEESGKGDSSESADASDSKAGDSGDSKSGDKPSDESGDAESAAAGESEPSGESSTEQARRMMSDRGTKTDSAEWDETPTTIDDFIEQEIGKEIKQQETTKKHRRGRRTVESDSHLPYSTERDVVEDHSGRGDRKRYRRILADVKKHVSPIKRELERSIKVIEKSRWKSECERGVLDTRNIHRLVSDRNFRDPFKQKQKVETNNVAVEILVDLSGSMYGPRIAVAKQTAIALAEALKDLNIPFEVSGWHSTWDEKLSRQSREAEVTRFNRVCERLECHIYKSFESHDLSGIERLNVGEQNPDGEGVRWAAKRLVAQKQKRKILIVLSDGQPATNEGSLNLLREDLKKSIAEATKAGIETVGIGIQSQAVSEFYKDHIVIEKINDLSKQAMKKLSQLLTKNFK